MAIVKQLNKKTGVTYVYESHSYRDKETKQPRSKRKLLGRLDEATGEIIPTRRNAKDVTTYEKNVSGSVKSESVNSSSALLELLQEKDETIKALRSEVSSLRREREHIAIELQRLIEGLNQSL